MSVLPTEPRRASRELWERSQLWHGVPKIGKTTMAAQFPNPIFLAAEPGLGALEVAEVEVRDQLDANGRIVGISAWQKFVYALHELETTKHGYQTVVVDTVNALWSSYRRWFLQKHDVEDENDGKYAYGKGGRMMMEEFEHKLAWLARLPMGVILISHAKEYAQNSKKKLTDNEVRIGPDLPPNARKYVLGMVDMILFFTFDDHGNRVLRTRSNPMYEAGSRIGTLADPIDMSYGALAEAYAKAISDNGCDPRATIIKRILAGEEYLAERGIDGFDTPKRKMNSRKLHATEKLEDATIAQLNGYLQRLQTHAKEQRNAEPEQSDADRPSGS